MATIMMKKTNWAFWGEVAIAVIRVMMRKR